MEHRGTRERCMTYACTAAGTKSGTTLRVLQRIEYTATHISYALSSTNLRYYGTRWWAWYQHPPTPYNL
eukprot:377831-Rhodomonas_salina.4